MLGLKEEPKAKKDDKQDKKPADNQNDEAKAILAKMQAKKDAGDCPFC